MPVLYVASWDDASGRAEGTRTVYQLLLPRRRHADGTWAWDELEVRDSAIQGLGVYPRPCDAIDWADVRVPALLPYLGVESVVEDQHLHKCLLAVLHGDFTSLTVGELCARHGGTYRRNGICAVRVADARTDVSKKGTAAHAPLGDEERLLQIIEGGGSSACYVLEKDTREMLHLQPRPAAAACAATGGSSVTSSVRAKHGEAVPGSGAHGHLFEMLASHERLHHVDRNLATHVATIKRDEGWVIVNAHPALGDGLNLVGIINEPLARCKPTLKLVHRSVELLPDGAPELARLGLRQPLDAEEVVRERREQARQALRRRARRRRRRERPRRLCSRARREGARLLRAGRHGRVAPLPPRLVERAQAAAAAPGIPRAARRARAAARRHPRRGGGAARARHRTRAEQGAEQGPPALRLPRRQRQGRRGGPTLPRHPRHATAAALPPALARLLLAAPLRPPRGHPGHPRAPPLRAGHRFLLGRARQAYRGRRGAAGHAAHGPGAQCGLAGQAKAGGVQRRGAEHTLSGRADARRARPQEGDGAGPGLPAVRRRGAGRVRLLRHRQALAELGMLRAPFAAVQAAQAGGLRTARVRRGVRVSATVLLSVLFTRSRVVVWSAR
ncbi:hypothetical protein T492DRAFT_1145767 [Pavlovales sp. CCMP2436]|nr:hypothetical protein T492DRAFT_1145767 [Pavlovales sp. CCMP2436]